MDDLEKHCGHTVDIGNLYRTLRKMENNKWIVSNWDKNSVGPDKRTYRITSEGTAVLHVAVTTLTKTHNLLFRFLDGYKKNFRGGASV